MWEDKKYVNQIIQQPKIVGAENLGFESGVPSEEIRKTADQLIGIGQDFCSLFVTETGQLRDFTDKEGRKKLQKAIVYMLDNVKGIGTTIHDHEENMKNLCKETLHAIPKEITTQFCKEDRKRLDFFQDKLNKYGKLL